MGRVFDEEKKYRCKFCKIETASLSDIVSENFQGLLGRAFLLRNLVNISAGYAEERHLSTGLYTVSDIYCSSCRQALGWRYDKAHSASEKYKEGLYILERESIC